MPAGFRRRWYYFNYYYTLNNKYALNAAGGSTGFPVTVGFLQAQRRARSPGASPRLAGGTR